MRLQEENFKILYQRFSTLIIDLSGGKKKLSELSEDDVEFIRKFTMSTISLKGKLHNQNKTVLQSDLHMHVLTKYKYLQTISCVRHDILELFFKIEWETPLNINIFMYAPTLAYFFTYYSLPPSNPHSFKAYCKIIKMLPNLIIKLNVSNIEQYQYFIRKSYLCDKINYNSSMPLDVIQQIASAPSHTILNICSHCILSQNKECYLILRDIIKRSFYNYSNTVGSLSFKKKNIELYIMLYEDIVIPQQEYVDQYFSAGFLLFSEDKLKTVELLLRQCTILPNTVRMIFIVALYIEDELIINYLESKYLLNILGKKNIADIIFTMCDVRKVCPTKSLDELFDQSLLRIY